MKVAAEVCPICDGTGWKTIANGANPRVTRCDCRIQARFHALLAAARIPKRYEHCELSEFDTHFEGAHPSLQRALLAAHAFVDNYPVEKTGLLIVGEKGLGKTHLAVGIMKELIAKKGIPCVFYDYNELLKDIQNSYNPTVQATELGLLRPVFETEVLVLDELGSVKPTDWKWDTIGLILNSRYNANKTTIFTTNFDDQPSAKGRKTLSPAQAAGHDYTLGDRIGDRLRSRLFEMCRLVRLQGEDFREKFRSASFR